MISIFKKLFSVEFKDSLKIRLFQFSKPSYLQNSHSQAGEDRILAYLFATLGISSPSYLDIGANKPIDGNNTYLFYEQGASGVCVEADPALLDDLKTTRPRDICLNVGVTFDDRKEADLYVFPVPALNTLDKEEAEYREKHGSYKIQKVIKIPLKSVNEIIVENFEKVPDLVSLDVEGIDLAILESLDFNKYRPLAICVETITYSENRTEEKIQPILDFMISKDYFIYADTHINTIFVDKHKF